MTDESLPQNPTVMRIEDQTTRVAIHELGFKTAFGETHFRIARLLSTLNPNCWQLCLWLFYKPFERSVDEPGSYLCTISAPDPVFCNFIQKPS